MRLTSSLSIIILAIITLSATPPSDIKKGIPPGGTLFTAGVGAGLIGGLYNGFYSYKLLKKHGDFGLGAPDKLDGEIMVFQGKIYQTQNSGKTFLVDDKELTPFAMVNFFHPDIRLTPDKAMNKAELFHYLDSVLTNINGMYAIHINGKFSYVKTRAFPPVKEDDHTPLANMLNLQHFFEFTGAQGDLIGYRLPSFMDNTNIAGYHFHYLSKQKDAGGHIIDLKTENIIIEIDILDSYTIQVPATKDFQHFDFKKNREEDIKNVERGGKN
ncbi:acetolactate decarboxylase [Chitinophaga oryziterrae]|uniref:Alpha-acetolactate decarboxylase n=1 Tax=Chitinophaga oryziterrae TaxID=1031224 RepID=A0A6N8JD20_9BACT|nr:acetolactate decarboxylase [Chitinophaga oryziterrae]MVT43215.1 acetolactate decarboxylase [Chitinophaga oryziterrae]